MSRTPDGQGAIFQSATDYDLPDRMLRGMEKYINFREISRGGTAILRSCFDLITGRTVAMKTLLPEHARDPQEQRRLLREARVTAQLQHPNTVPVYEIGRDLQYGLYFTMKRISGENFFEILKRVAREDAETTRDFPLARRVEILTDAAQALAYAHARGVIHRDLKPENIWVGNFGEVILLDWGVAKVWGQPDDAPQHPAIAHRDNDRLQELTMAGQRPGTPLYMSPEQVNVNRAQVDERTDVFSAGVVLYELAALREPFRGRVLQETFENIIDLTPPPPSERSPERGIPKTLDGVVMRAIEKKPADRFQTMREMIEALRAVDYSRC
ncbi:MAG: serine/threonine protein kinase [Planctomycetales bacterium]|nr:serine/threonine protein kinase [Planctomycetales bacterium]